MRPKRMMLVLMVIALMALSTPAMALIGSSPLVVFKPISGGNLYGSIEIDAVANKGIVKAAESDRFSLRITGTFTTDGNPITKVSWDAAVEKSKNLQLVSGSNVGIIMDLDLSFVDASKLKGVLDQGKGVEWKLRIELVLTTGNGGEKTVDFTEVSDTLTPTQSPQFEPTKA